MAIYETSQPMYNEVDCVKIESRIKAGYRRQRDQLKLYLTLSHNITYIQSNVRTMTMGHVNASILSGMYRFDLLHYSSSSSAFLTTFVWGRCFV